MTNPRCIKCGQRAMARTDRAHPTKPGVWWACETAACGWGEWKQADYGRPPPEVAPAPPRRAARLAPPAPVTTPPPAKPYPCHQMVYRKPQPVTRPTLTAIAETARALLGVDADSFYSSSRHPLSVLARMLTVVVARRTTILSYPKLAKGMGPGGHSTWITSMRRYEELQGLTSREYVIQSGPRCKDRTGCIPDGLKEVRLLELAATVEREVLASLKRSDPNKPAADIQHP